MMAFYIDTSSKLTATHLTTTSWGATASLAATQASTRATADRAARRSALLLLESPFTQTNFGARQAPCACARIPATSRLLRDTAPSIVVRAWEQTAPRQWKTAAAALPPRSRNTVRVHTRCKPAPASVKLLVSRLRSPRTPRDWEVALDVVWVCRMYAGGALALLAGPTGGLRARAGQRAGVRVVWGEGRPHSATCPATTRWGATQATAEAARHLLCGCPDPPTRAALATPRPRPD